MLNAYMTDSVVLKQAQGSDTFGEPLAAVNVTIKGRVDYKTRQVTSISGQQVVATGIVTIAPRTIIKNPVGRASNTICYNDRIVIGSIEYGIIRISQVKDFSVRALEVYIA